MFLIGRILNRFSKDLDVIDMTLAESFYTVGRLALSLIGTIVAITIAAPIFLLLVFPLAMIYWFIKSVFVRSARQIKRLESAAQSPLYGQFSETISGLPTIRGYNMQEKFMDDTIKCVDFRNIFYHASIVSDGWLSIRLEVIANLIVLFASIVPVIYRDTLNPGTAGLALTYASGVTTTLNLLVAMMSRVETNMVNVERAKEYQDGIPKEAAHKIPEYDPPNDWPQLGEIEFRDYNAKYREGMDNALENISCKINVSITLVTKRNL